MEEEEAGQAELGDEGELLAQALVRLVPQLAGRVAVALVEGAPADLRELHVGGRRPVGEVRVAVAELVREVEGQPLGELGGRLHRAGVVREAGGGLLRREEDAVVVPAPLRLAAFERGAVLDGDEDVLEARAARVVGVHVPGGHRAHAEGLRERAQRSVPAGVAALEGALELDVEAVAAERAGEARGGVRGRGRPDRAARSPRGRRAPPPAPPAAPGRGAG